MTDPIENSQPSRPTSEAKLASIRLPTSLAGSKVLDIGARDGYFSFLNAIGRVRPGSVQSIPLVGRMNDFRSWAFMLSSDSILHSTL